MLEIRQTITLTLPSQSTPPTPTTTDFAMGQSQTKPALSPLPFVPYSPTADQEYITPCPSPIPTTSVTQPACPPAIHAHPLSQTYLPTPPTCARSADPQFTQTPIQPRAIHRLGSFETAPRTSTSLADPGVSVARHSVLPPLPTPRPLDRAIQPSRITIHRGKSFGLANRLTRKASRRPQATDSSAMVKPFDSVTQTTALGSSTAIAATSLNDDMKKFEAAVISAEARSGIEPPKFKRHSSMDSTAVNKFLNGSFTPLTPLSSTALPVPASGYAAVRREAVISASHHHRRSSSGSVYSEQASIKSSRRAEREWRARVAALGHAPAYARSSVLRETRGGPVPPKRSQTPGRVFVRGMAVPKLAVGAFESTPSRSTGTPFNSLGSTPESDNVMTPAQMSTGSDHFDDSVSPASSAPGHPIIRLSAGQVVETPRTPAKIFRSGKSFETLGFHRSKPADQTLPKTKSVREPKISASGVRPDALRSVSTSSHASNPSPIPYRVLQLQDHPSAVRDRKVSVPLSVSSVGRSVSSFYFDNNASHVSTRPSSFAISNLHMPAATPDSTPERYFDFLPSPLRGASSACGVGTKPEAVIKRQAFPQIATATSRASASSHPVSDSVGKRPSPIATIALKESTEDNDPPAIVDATSADTVVNPFTHPDDAPAKPLVPTALAKPTQRRLSADSTHRTPTKRQQRIGSLDPNSVSTSPTTSYLLTAPIESISWSIQMGQETPEKLRSQAHPYARTMRSIEGDDQESDFRKSEDVEELDEEFETAVEGVGGMRKGKQAPEVPPKSPSRSKTIFPTRLPPPPPRMDSLRSLPRVPGPIIRHQLTDDIFTSSTSQYISTTPTIVPSPSTKYFAQPVSSETSSVLRNRRQVPAIQLQFPASKQATKALDVVKAARSNRNNKPTRSKLGKSPTYHSYAVGHGSKEGTGIKDEVLGTGADSSSRFDLTPGMHNGQRPPKTGLPMAVSGPHIC